MLINFWIWECWFKSFYLLSTFFHIFLKGRFICFHFIFLLFNILLLLLYFILLWLINSNDSYLFPNLFQIFNAFNILFFFIENRTDHRYSFIFDLILRFIFTIFLCFKIRKIHIMRKNLLWTYCYYFLINFTTDWWVIAD